ncbi:MAG: hypothetical protein MPW17_08450 [Candidatus Manganitrophus sp.]|nr:MAG: hypothetical protein MPW17_08450 [Candidatus Manganitrophus sp.]
MEAEGGGGGNNNQNAAPAAQAAGSASKAVSTALNLAINGMNGTVPSFKPGGAASISDAAQVSKALKAFKSAVANRKARRALSRDEEFDCEVSGKFRITTEDHDNEDPLDDTTTTTYTDCSDSEGSVTNGSLVMTLGGDLFSFNYNDYVIRTTFSGAVSEIVFDGGFSFESVNGDCGMESATMIDDLSFTTKFDQAGDGTFEVNSSFATNMTMALAQAFAEDCTPGANTMTLNGGTTSTNNVDSESEVVTFTDFTMVMTPATREINGVETNGDILSLNGTIEVSSSCTDATTFTISTPAGEEPFVPEDGSCPVDGKFIITNGGNTVAVIYTSTGGVQIDEGNNGSIDDTFASCDDAEGICT